MDTVASAADMEAALAMRLEHLQQQLKVQSVIKMDSVAAVDGKPISEPVEKKRKRSQPTGDANSMPTDDKTAETEQQHVEPKVTTKEKRRKRVKDESAAIQASETRAALMNTSWSSESANEANSSSSDTESDTEDVPDDKPTDQEQQSIESKLIQIAKELTREATKIRNAPTSQQDSKRQELLVVYAKLVEGVGLLGPNQAAVVVSDGLLALTGQVARICRRKTPNMFKHVCILEDTLRQRVETNSGFQALRSLQSKVSEAVQSHKPSWEMEVRGVVQVALHMEQGKLCISKDSTTHYIDLVCSAFYRVGTDTSVQITKATEDHCCNVIACTARLFGKPPVDSTFVHLLDAVMESVEAMVSSSAQLSSVRKKAEALVQIREKLVPPPTSTQDRPTHEPKHKVPDTEERILRRFQRALDRIKALAPSKRRSKVAIFTLELQNQLKMCLPKSGPAPSLTKATVQGLADHVSEAIELTKQEPHDNESIAFVKQFLELVYATGSRYPAFNKRVTRSRDELCAYLYPESITAATKPASKKTETNEVKRAQEAALREDLAKALDNIRSWEGDIFSIKQFDAVSKVTAKAFQLRSKTWDVKGDAAVRECVELLTKRAHAIQKAEHRKPRQQMVAQWKKTLQ